MTDQKDLLFEKAPVPAAYFKLALPVVFGMVISLVYNMVDTYFIAQTHNTALIAGVSLSAPMFTFLIAMGDIFGLGGSSLLSRLLGQRKEADAKRLSAVCFYASLALGLVIAAAMLLLKNPILTLLGADAETWQHAGAYYTWLAVGAPFVVVSFTPANLLRTEGFATASMVGNMIGAVVNIILDPVFIFALNGGAAGAAAATSLGNVCAVGYYVWFLLFRSRKLSVDPRLVKASGQEMGSILSIGIPASITNLAQSLGAALLNRFLLPYGTVCVAAMGIVMKVNMIAVLVLVGFAFGAQPLIGFNYGAGNRRRLGQILRFAYGFECGLALALSAILWLAAPVLLRLFVNDSAIIEAGVPMMRMQMLSMVCVAAVLVSTVLFQSLGNAPSAFALSASRQGVIFAPVLLAASRLGGYTGVIASQPMADLLTACLMALLLLGTVRQLRNMSDRG